MNQKAQDNKCLSENDICLHDKFKSADDLLDDVIIFAEKLVEQGSILFDGLIAGCAFQRLPHLEIA